MFGISLLGKQQILIQAGTDIRQLSHDLHPPLLQDAGLPKAVHAYCEQFSMASGIPVACEADERVGDMARGTAVPITHQSCANDRYAQWPSALVRSDRSRAKPRRLQTRLSCADVHPAARFSCLAGLRVPRRFSS